MAAVIFYEKPGCINNTRQKGLLTAAGHELDVRDLLSEPWTAESLQPYLSGLPVADWFNRAAPAIKVGEIQPERLDVDEALSLLLADPLLIRRPLMRSGQRYMVGFDQQLVADWIGLVAEQESEDLEQCPRNRHQQQC